MPQYKATIDVAFTAPDGEDQHEVIGRILAHHGVTVEGCVVEQDD